MATSVFKVCLGCFAWLSLGATVLLADPRNVPHSQTLALKLLNLGFESRIVSLEELKRVYESEKSRLPEDSPYLEYAYSLVLSKNLQPMEAEIHLRAAAESRLPILLPAHEELIRRTIVAADYQAALEKLAEYACLLGEMPVDGPSAEEAHRGAGWLGGMVAYLEGPAKVPADVKNLSKLTGDQLKLLLDQRYVKGYDAGRQAVHETSAGMERQLNEAITQSTSKQGDDRQELKAKKDQIEQRAAELKEASSSAQKTAREQLNDLDNKIKLLEKQFSLSLEAEQRLMASQILLQAEIDRLRGLLQFNERSNERQSPTSPFSRTGQLNGQLMAAEAQYALSINQQAVLIQSRYELMGTARGLLQSRQELAQKAGVSAAQTQSQLDLMKRWEQRLEAEEKKQDKADVGESAGAVRIRRRMSDLSTYDQDSLEHRRQAFVKLLQGVGAAVENSLPPLRDQP